jgi:hypothetical protein
MLKAELVELRAANPVSHDNARRVADLLDLHRRVLAFTAEEPAGGAVPLTSRPARHARGRAVVAVLAAAAVLAAILAATPAWALVRNVLPFWGQPVAPQSVQLQFYSLNIGAPPGMSPRAAAGETREVGRFAFGGSSHTLWVAPARNGGFCSLWLPAGGGGCSTSGKPLGTGALLRLGVPEWITGDATVPAVSDVVIRFSDGSAVQPRIVWVSAPIDAGFFAYDVPPGEQSTQRHVTAVDAYDRRGTLVEHQTLTDAGPAG